MNARERLLAITEAGDKMASVFETANDGPLVEQSKALRAIDELLRDMYSEAAKNGLIDANFVGRWLARATALGYGDK